MEYKSEKRICQNCKKNFVIEPNDFGFYEKVKVPPPTFCPPCRMQRRYAWRNHMCLYNGKCNLCGKSVITLYAPNSGITIYCNKCWWSDKWDPKSYAMDYDFSKPFFVQFIELMKKVPHMATVNDDGIASLNCEYTHDWWFSKNCYMTFSGWYVENVMYSFFITAGKDMMDCLLNMSETSFLYECINCTHGYKLKYSFFSRACINSQFLYDCADCSNCFMCSGLRNKKYYFKNKQYSKEEYEKILEDYRLDTFNGVEKAQKEYDNFILKYPRRFAWVRKNENSFGDIVSYSKNTKDCFVAKKSENCRYCDFITNDKECYDITMSGETQECYEGIVVDHSQLNLFGIFSPKCQDVRYTQHCHNCKHVFGCDALRNTNYSILNKQYTKKEYEELVPKIIKHMNDMPYVDKKGNVYRFGEFFPAELSPFGYNETQAPEQFPLTKEEAIKNGFNWQDNIQKTIGKETLLPEKIPESINDISENILDEILVCIECKRNYKIIQNELIFYKKMGIPIPRRCFYCRHNNRVKRRNPFKLWHRTCMNDGCENEFETSYAPDRPEIIYCEKCYQKEVY
ncbi:MAG: hypothetical protein WC662_04125 [Candidatus Paceibacterota bacterium]|jgi:hypothetical protein